MPTREQFLGHLKDALSHLHDPERLRRSPLVREFGLSDQFDAAAQLRGALVSGIRELKPVDDETASEQSWRTYDSLFCCYVQQLSQRVASDQLGISPRQLRREQRIALERLADALWTRFDRRCLTEDEGQRDPSTASTGPTLGDELAWLRDRAEAAPTDVEKGALDAVALVAPLAAQHGVHVMAMPTTGLPPTSAHPAALSQALLNLLSLAITQSPPGGDVRLDASGSDQQLQIRVQGFSTHQGRAVGDARDPRLAMSHRLVDLCGGTLMISAPDGAFVATVSLPVYREVPVLVVDDNADALQLMERFASRTPYRLICTREPEHAIDLARDRRPQVIVLDVMMPELDGWHVLGQLRQHPATTDIPTIVCTILPQKELALSLGASDFILKPVTREAFLRALRRASEPTAKAPP